LKYILANKESLKSKIKKQQQIVKEELSLHVEGLIVPIVVDDNKKVLDIKDELFKDGYAIGAIRQPTVQKAIIRLIARLGQSEDELRVLCKKLAKITK
jgi:8-amino-7-oxononanoate synthase